MVAYAPRPLILIRGFGGPDISAEQASAYQGFNDGTVYPHRRGDNYIYEGFVLRALKSERYRYCDATNVIGYYAHHVDAPHGLAERRGYTPGDLAGTVVIDPANADRVIAEAGPGTIWVYRYYDLSPRSLRTYGHGLVRLIQLIRTAMLAHGHAFSGVDVVAHSMGGLVLREALRDMQAAEPASAGALIHRIVTLGTPHRGIAFQRLPGWLLHALPGVDDAADELLAFSPTSTDFLDVARCFPIRRVLTVVGTNYHTYQPLGAALANRLSTLFDEHNLETNRSDGLVKQSAAQLPGAPRTFIHKCHGGRDSLVTSREAYEIAMRFFHGTHRVRLWLDRATVLRGGDWFGASEFYLGITIKPRYVDFEMFHQSVEAENCYGPFHHADLSDGLPALEEQLRKTLAAAGDQTTGWAGPDRLLWEGWLDAHATPERAARGMVLRLDVYVGERDSRGIGFSDNVIFRKQYYLQFFTGEPPVLFVHTGEQYLSTTNPLDQHALQVLAAQKQPQEATADVRQARTRTTTTSPDGHAWSFDVSGTGFTATLHAALAADH